MFQSNKPTAGPAIVTPSVFRSTLIQGVVRDNYPLTFGEGEGMRQVFGLVSPELRLPVHSTMRKDLAKLHKVLSKRVQQVLNLKAMDPMDDNDPEQYSIVKSFREGEVFEESAEVTEEEERLQSEEQNYDGQLDPVDILDDKLNHLEESSQANVTDSNSQSGQNPNDELNCIQKVHAIAVDITSSAARRKRMRMITRALGLERRAIIKSVRVRWNSILAEVRQAILLKPAINQYVATMDEGKTGVALRRARTLKKKWTIIDEEWDALKELVIILEPFEAATRDYSRRGRTVLHAVLPTYSVLRQKLVDNRVRLSMSSLGSSAIETLIEAVEAGEEKLEKYFNLALKSDITLLASILHPGMRLKYFQDTRAWGIERERLVKRGEGLLEYLYDVYKEETALERAEIPPNSSSRLSTSQSGWIDGLLQISDESDGTAFPEEVRTYLDGKYRYKGGDILIWWKENESNLPVLSRIARDILAIPATSVSVERLFSQCKLVMSDYRNMSIDTARQIITCQQWLEAGLGVDLPNFVSNDCI
ncbi:hypothetical protein BN14_11386 [Rhizoctonia solani AG-1 IB]|uniref:HAT C-terminal dimerisation domain-containing protein n=1 Tax=Thanatephorus cucumeris (strain AG1-IB / isolate 7/3/14) TaxID=1108050 RepID=M5CCQ6_THACB|nr:hypothetical protein BN14_11386 [Rhizoctonia solani AG-1 IB]